MWVRGLKLGRQGVQTAPHPSHPMWVRGLKLSFFRRPLIDARVAPYVGAWIETYDLNE